MGDKVAEADFVCCPFDGFECRSSYCLSGRSKCIEEENAQLEAEDWDKLDD